ncbi:MAG: DUF4252 domain-containing protein [Bacteroidia bacterium]|nr:DUF4252 domain-containing protein [Bacteroidia bacterium]
MKLNKIVFALSVFLLTCAIWGCGINDGPQARLVFDKYGAMEQFNVLSFHPSVFLIIEDKDNQDLAETIKKLDDIRILRHDMSDANRELTRKFLNDVKVNFPKNEYQDLMVIKEGKERVVFKVKEQNQRVKELIMQMFDENTITIALLSGDIDIEKVSQLANKLNVSGLKNLDIIGSQN